MSNFKSPITSTFVKCGCSIYFFLKSTNLICRSTDISKYCPLEFEITRVDCSSKCSSAVVVISVLRVNNEILKLENILQAE